MSEKQKPNLEDIKLLVIDVDGVLTDGKIQIAADGSETKQFSVLDGFGIRVWHRAGFATAIISGRYSQATIHRAHQLEIKYILQDCRQKLPHFEKLLEETGFSVGQVAYIGDDLIDLPIVLRAGFAVAVANAVDELKHHAHYITNRTGGCGAVREVIEHILKSTGKWQQLTQRYSDEPAL